MSDEIVQFRLSVTRQFDETLAVMRTVAERLMILQQVETEQRIRRTVAFRLTLE